MIRSGLLKAAMLGLCLSAFPAGIASAGRLAVPAELAQEREEALTKDQEALYSRQEEIDRYLFAEHAGEIKEKGFSIYSTVVAGDVIEIGIVPFTKENADYLYNIFGNDMIKVVEGDISIIYASGFAGSDTATAEPEMIEGAGNDGSTGAAIDPIAPDLDEAISPEDAVVYDGEMTIQIESFDGDTDTAEDGVVKDASASASSTDDSNVEVRTTAAENYEILTVNTEDASDQASTPMLVLAIAGGAVILGGAAIAYSRKKEKNH